MKNGSVKRMVKKSPLDFKAGSFSRADLLLSTISPISIRIAYAFALRFLSFGVKYTFAKKGKKKT